MVLERKPTNASIGIAQSTAEKCTSALHSFLATVQFDHTILSAKDPQFTRISIVMPSYNQVTFIERSILSVLNQNYPNLQFIIMDGGSTDGTVEIIRKYERYLTWRSERDRGQADALNKALQLADGELVGWQNSDDVYFPGAFQRMHELSRRRPRAVLYNGTVVKIDSEDRITYISKYIRPSRLRLLYEGFIMSSQGVFWRRDIQSSVGFYNPDLYIAMDVDFWLRVLEVGTAEFLPQIIGGFRAHEGTKTSSFAERGRAEIRQIRMKYGVDDQSRSWKVMRAGLRTSRLICWALNTRRRCAI